MESDYCFADYEPKLVTEDGHYYVGNSYSAEFLSTVNPKASVLVDPIGHLLPEDNGILSYDEKTETFKVLKAGEAEIPFVSSRGVSKTLRVQTEDKPILGIRADQEDGQVEAGSSIPLSATILPAIPANAGKYTAEITSGQTEADLSKGENGGYVLSVRPDAETGATIVVTFTSVGVKEDGEKAVTTNVFTVKAAQTGGLEELLVGSWQDDGYPASTLTFNSDKTGFVEYNSWSGAYYFKFTWNNATETALADEGSFVEVDEFGEPGPDNFFVLSSFRYENASIVLEFEYEGPLVFAKVGS